jgi:heme A synthase
MTTPPRSMAFARFAWGVLAYNLLVILWGAFVRASGSGAGCGAHWPDCNGEVIPRAESLETAIELTHRLTSGVALLLVVAQVVWAFRAFPRGDLARRATGAAMFLMLTEAGLGAALVLLEHVGTDARIGRAGWMALHLVNTFLLVAALTLSAWWASGGRGLEGRAPARLDPGGGVGMLLGIGGLALLVTGMAGAVTALGDTLFPASSLAEGLAADLSPTAHFLVRLRVIHPVVATLSFLYLLMMAAQLVSLRPDPVVRRAAIALATAMAVQMAAGLLNLALLAPVWMQLVHLLLADLAWIALVLLSASALGAKRRAASGDIALAA